MAGLMGGEGVTNRGVIGKGAFGVVYLVENPEGEQFAVKVMEWLHANPTNKGVVENELRVLKELSHENVLAYVDHFMDKGLMYIITEYCNGGDLSDFLDQVGSPLPEDLLRVWLWQMACGLEYMHNHESSQVLHRDLKPSNVYLTEDGTVRLGDMGIARKLDQPGAMAETFCGTPPYMSPEALYEKPYNHKTDIWSLGCCVVEMATLERAYDGATLFLLRNAVLEMRQPLPGSYSRELDSLVSEMLLPDYRKRASASDVLDHSALQHCHDVEAKTLLRKHKLQGALAMHRRSSDSTTFTSLPSRVTADETVLTLTSSLANLKVILNEGEPISTYRIKVDRRMRGRRQDDSTLTNSSSLKTVLYKPETSVSSKSTKKKPKVPTKVNVEAQGPDDSLSRPVLSSMTSTVMSIGKSTKSRQGPLQKGKEQTEAASASEAPRSTQMETLRNSLSQLIPGGGDALATASSLVQSGASREELMSGLAPLVGEYKSFLTNIVVYLLLMESVSSRSSSQS